MLYLCYLELLPMKLVWKFQGVSKGTPHPHLSPLLTLCLTSSHPPHACPPQFSEFGSPSPILINKTAITTVVLLEGKFQSWENGAGNCYCGPENSSKNMLLKNVQAVKLCFIAFPPKIWRGNCFRNSSLLRTIVLGAWGGGGEDSFESHPICDRI